MRTRRAEPEETRERARRLVDFWRRRGWLSSSSPVHVHPLDLTKLEDLIVAELDQDEES